MAIIMDICKICGIKLNKPISELQHEFCSCCGCHFGLDDFDLEYAREHRQEWYNAGKKWWSEHSSPPENWNPDEQLKNIPPEWQ